MKRIFDASAILAVIFTEPGCGATIELWQDGENYVSSVNYAEVIAKLNESGMSDLEVSIVLEGVPLVVLPFNADHAFSAGLLRKETKTIGLSLGDRACLATGQIEKAQIITADRLWKTLKRFKVTVVR